MAVREGLSRTGGSDGRLREAGVSDDIRAKADQRDLWPERFPQGCYLVGYRAFVDREPLLGPYCREQADKRRRQLRQAAGTAGEGRLLREVSQLDEIIKEIEGWN